jgi:hypothetical protein
MSCSSFFSSFFKSLATTSACPACSACSGSFSSSFFFRRLLHARRLNWAVILTRESDSQLKKKEGLISLTKHVNWSLWGRLPTCSGLLTRLAGYQPARRIPSRPGFGTTGRCGASLFGLQPAFSRLRRWCRHVRLPECPSYLRPAKNRRINSAHSTPSTPSTISTR